MTGTVNRLSHDILYRQQALTQAELGPCQDKTTEKQADITRLEKTKSFEYANTISLHS